MPNLFLIFDLKVAINTETTHSMRKTKVTFDSQKLHVSTELMRALAHPLRLKILEFIDTHGTINVNKIYNTLRIEQSITSQHLKILRLSGVVNAQKDGKYMHYNINYTIVERAQKAVSKFLASEKLSEA